MKELAKRILIGCIGFVFIYLFGSFFNVSFDISKWGEGSRLIVTFFGSLAFIMLATYPESNFKNK
jgi:hypothetical protein